MNSRNNHSMRTVLIIIIIVILAAVIAVSVFLNFQKIPKAVCNQESDHDREVCLSEEARTTEDPSYCEGITDHNLFYACTDKLWNSSPCTYALLIGKTCDDYWLSEAKENKDITACNRMSSPEQKDVCELILAELSIADGVNYCVYCQTVPSFTSPTSTEPVNMTFCQNMTCFATYLLETKDMESACSIFEDKQQCISSMLNVFVSRASVSTQSTLNSTTFVLISDSEKEALKNDVCGDIKGYEDFCDASFEDYFSNVSRSVLS